MRRTWIVGVVVLVTVLLGCDDGGECPLDCAGKPIIFPYVDVTLDSTSATLAFSVDARGSETSCECEYSGATGDWLLSNSVLAGADWGPRQLTLLLSDLDPETWYLYRLNAVSSAGFSSTEVDSFQTLRLNLFPDTFVTGEPPESIPGGGYRIRLFWFGTDTDGTIDHFEWMTSESDPPGVWHSTIRRDSTFVISAGFSGEWVFTISAVDNDGGSDESPANYAVTIGKLLGFGQ